MYEDELNDAKAGVSSVGKSPDDFEFRSEGASATYYAPAPEKGEVHVCYKPTGVIKIYDSGHDIAWPAHFIDDLRAGHFD